MLSNRNVIEYRVLSNRECYRIQVLSNIGCYVRRIGSKMEVNKKGEGKAWVSEEGTVVNK